MTSSAAAKAYYASTDYYKSCPGDWLGKGAAMLGLSGTDSPEHFYSLADNLDPRTGTQLSAAHRDGRRVGMDLTFNSTKSVGIARELASPGNEGDARIEHAHREAVEYAMRYVEADMQTRVRVGGADEDRVTANLVAYRVTHRDTRISPEDQRPDMSLHDHVFVFNATYDPVEERWKAAQMGGIKHDANFYEAIYHNRLASNLRDLGYGIRRDGRSFELQGIDRSLIEKFSRRTKQIEAVAKKLGIKNVESKAKLGATTRMGKAAELADDLNGYYVSRLTDKEKTALQKLEGQPSYQCDVGKAVDYAVGHLFERQSVVGERKLYETAIRHGIGSVTPEGVRDTAWTKGLLVREGQATTKAVLAEEQKVIAFARDGRGTCRPLGKKEGRPDESKRPHSREARPDGPVSLDTGAPRPGQQAVFAQDINVLGKLSAEQAAMVEHVLTSPDRVILVRGAAGTGKTTAMKSVVARIDAPVALLAPTVTASRGVLREDGFADADTLASFLGDRAKQDRVKNGVIYLDEAPLTPIKDLVRLIEVAQEKDARLILQGDPRQHKSVLRSGNIFQVLQDYAGLPVAELKDIRRQSGRYKEAVAAIEAGDVLKGFDAFADMGWVKTVRDDKALVDDYLDALATKRKDQTDRDRAIILAPTHAEGEGITNEIRQRLKADGKLGDELTYQKLIPLHWSEAQRADLHGYTGSEYMVFKRNSGTFKAGQVVKVADWRPGDFFRSAAHFQVYERGEIPIAVGDVIRTTENVKDARGRQVDNGTHLTVRSVTPKGIDVVGSTGTVRTLPPNVNHIAHGYVSTSIGGQGRTTD